MQLVLKCVARLNEMADVVVEELAWQMGRPVRYGGEFKGFNERSNYVATIAADALAPLKVKARTSSSAISSASRMASSSSSRLGTIPT